MVGIYFKMLERRHTDRPEDRDEDVRGPTVDGLELHAIGRHRQRRPQLRDPGQPTVRDRDAAADTRARERLALLEHPDDVLFADPVVDASEEACELPQRRGLVLGAQPNGDPLDGQNVREAHVVDSRERAARSEAPAQLSVHPDGSSGGESIAKDPVFAGGGRRASGRHLVTHPG